MPETKSSRSHQPIIKWVGGKTQLINKIMSSFPDEIENYYEPFLGGGSVLLALLSSGKCVKKIFANDINSHLIQMYKDVQERPEELIEELHTLCNEYFSCPIVGVCVKTPTNEQKTENRETYYYWCRGLYNSIKVRECNVKTSTLFIFLNKTGFRGMYREGPNGFNVPYGNYKNPTIFVADEIMNMSKLIKNVEFHNSSYSEFLSHVTPEDFVYLDPPYALETIKSFVGYHKHGFCSEEQTRLFDMCKKFSESGVNFVMSNSHVPVVTDFFDGFEIDVVEAKRSINSKNPGSKSNEVIIRCKH